jgi:hypothetical protein
VLCTAGDSVLTMDLLKSIRNGRARHRKKQPHQKAMIDTVIGLVKHFGLGESFLELLNETRDQRAGKAVTGTPVRARRAFDLPPFSLVSQEQFRLAAAIVGRVGNPYLGFARSPEDILWSAPLYAANPGLGPEELLGLDFETLLVCERAKKELAELKGGLGTASDTIIRDQEPEAPGGQGASPDLRRERIQQLQAFIANVADTRIQ